MRWYFTLCYFMPVFTLMALVTQDYNLIWALPGIFVSFIFAMYGFSVGMHHTFTHSTFKFSKRVEDILAWVSFYAMLQSPISWGTVHKAHHKYADKKGDPHSPILLGKKIWLPWNHELTSYEKPIKRVIKNKTHQFIHRNGWMLLLHPVLAASLGLEAFIFLYMVPIAYIKIIEIVLVAVSHGGDINSHGDHSKMSKLLYVLALGDGDHEQHHKNMWCPPSHKFFANIIGNKNVSAY